MRAQSSIEFLSTYGFVFLIIGIAIVVIFFLATYTNTVVSTQCTSFSDIACNFVNYYTGMGYGIFSLSISNAQTAPINITGINVSIDGSAATGMCSPNFLYQGQEATCIAVITANALKSGLVEGTYYINAGFCVSPANQISMQGCKYLDSNYSGSFQLYEAKNDTTPFSTIVAYVPGNVQLQQMPSSPYIPQNYTITQNGDFVPHRNLTGFDFAFGSWKYLGDSYVGTNVVTYPSVLSDIGSNTVPCTPPYQSVASVAYSAFYMPSSGKVSFAAYADNAIGVYYRGAGWNGWVNAFSGSGWTLNPQPNTEYTYTNTLGTGLYQIAVEHVNTCGEDLQALSVNGIGQ